MFQNRIWKVIYAVLVGVGFLFIVVGYGTPGWITIIGSSPYVNTKVDFGLWYFRACSVVPNLVDDICRTVDYKDLDNYPTGSQQVKSTTDIVGKSREK